MKILHVITSLHPDGAQQMMRRIVDSTRGEATHVIVSLARRAELSSYFEESKLKVFHLDCSNRSNPWRVARDLRNIVEQEKPDVLQSWLYHANLVAAIAVRGSKIPVPLIWGIRSAFSLFRSQSIPTTLLILFSRWYCHIPRSITVNSIESLEQHVAIGFPRERMHYLPNGYDTDRFSRDESSRELLRKSLGFDSENVVISVCGRDNFTKDYPTFLRAFKRVQREAPHVRALLVGRGVDSSSSITEEIASLGIKDYVKRVGYVANPQSYYSAADIGCSSSQSEGFPNVVAEAMLCQLPMVVTDVGMSRILVGQDGITVPPRDSAALAKGLLDMVQLSTQERLERGLRSRSLMMSEYSISHIVSKFMALYKSMISE